MRRFLRRFEVKVLILRFIVTQQIHHIGFYGVLPDCAVDCHQSSLWVNEDGVFYSL